MKISYRREMKYNYLIIDPEELIWKNYECRMLAENSIEGVLRFQLRQVDDEIRFFYEITSRQPLDRLLENQAVGAEELRRMVLAISATLDRMEQYLLREGCILLKPEYIYVEPDTFRIWLCLVPGMQRDFPADYGKLLEYLLGKVDHQDKDSVVLAYGLYQETRKENYGMEDILRLLNPEEAGADRSRKRREREYGTEKAEMESGRSGELESGRSGEADGGRSVGAKELQPYSKPEPGVSTKKTGIWRRFCCWLRRERDEKAQEQIRVPMELLFREEEAPKIPAAEQGAYRRPVTEQGKPRRPVAEHDTVLLADLSQSGGSKIHCLRALDRDMEDIEIPYVPFIIGKQENLADYLLRYDTVSRLHVRIDETEDGWKIQDLNSTNGTMVGGRLLENNETADVHIGDEVRIAEFRYRFE